MKMPHAKNGKFMPKVQSQSVKTEVRKPKEEDRIKNAKQSHFLRKLFRDK